MAEETGTDGTRVEFTLDNPDPEGETNYGFVLEDDYGKEIGVGKIGEKTSDNQEDPASDYYSGSPSNSLKNAEDEKEEIDHEAKRRCRRKISAHSGHKSSTVSNPWAHLHHKNIGSAQKFRDFTMGTSYVYAISLGMIALTILTSLISAKTLDASILWAFLAVMHCLSILAVSFFFFQGFMKKLTIDEHHKHKRTSIFIRGGMLVLGTGGMLYFSLSIAMYIHDQNECLDDLFVTGSILSIIFIAFQVAFLLTYSKIRINRSRELSIASRYLIMQLIGTNICMWLTAVFYESVEEIDGLTKGKDGNKTTKPHTESPTQSTLNGQDVELSSILFCPESDLHIVEILEPYLLPLMIEFCVIASSMCLAVWENCGNGWLKIPQNEEMEQANSNYKIAADSESLYTITKSEVTTTQSSSHAPNPRHHHPPSNYFNNNLGLVLGWAVIVCSVVIIIVVLYYLYSNTQDDVKELMIYGLNLALSIAGIIAIPITLYKMSILTFKDDEIKALRVKHIDGTNAPTSFKGIHRKMDKGLLFNTYIAMMTFKIFVMISAYVESETVIFTEGLVSMIFGFLQVIFINWYAFQKRVTTEEDREVKPGRQGLEFLRCCNFALWLVNTFLLKNQFAKRIMYKTFGNEAWAIMSNILQPLSILYYFHAMVCLAEVIGHTYSAKYVGVARPWKRPKIRKGRFTKSASALSIRNGLIQKSPSSATLENVPTTAEWTTF